MNQKIILPATIFIIQFLGIIYLGFEYKFGNSHIPVAFIFLNILAIFSGIVLIFSWFFYFKTPEKLMIWKIVIGVSVAITLALMMIYIFMGFDKYS